MSVTGEAFESHGRRPSYAERWIRRVFAEAGIEPGGGRAWDPVVHDRRFYLRTAIGGSLGLGEAYMDGLWHCDDLGEFVRRLIAWRDEHRNRWNVRLPSLALDASFALRNLQTRARAGRVIDVHYDLPAGLFEHMLGPSMAYSCAYWHGARDLDDAQWRKLDLICRKLELAPGQRLLDLGCGFGSLSRHAAMYHGCEVVAVTLSESQATFARRHCAGLPVTIHVCDYRDTDRYGGDRPFDRIASIAMFEAVGRRNVPGFMHVVRELLEDRGLWLLHTIGAEHEGADAWIERYIFPNGELLGLGRVCDAAHRLFRVEDVHEFGPDYVPTLAAWRDNFLRQWPAIRAIDPRFNERFRRMWVYYLESCRGAFLARNNRLWQLVMSPPRRLEPYRASR